MELGNRKNEAKNELKRQDIVIEVEYSHTHILHRPDERPSPCTTEQWGHWVISGQRSRKRNGTTCESLSVSLQQHFDPCGSVTDIITAALSCFLVLILVGMEFATVSGGGSRRRPSRPNPNHGIGIRVRLPSPRIHLKPLRETNSICIQLEI